MPRNMSRDEEVKKHMSEPSGHVYVVMQNHGEDEAGWGPACGFTREGRFVGPWVYSSDNEETIQALTDLTQRLFMETGKPSAFIKYTNPEIVRAFGMPNEM